MKNDKERREFVDNEDNWRIFDTASCMALRVKVLEYGNMAWYKVEAKRVSEHFDHKTRRVVTKPNWRTLDMYSTGSGDMTSFGEHVSVTQIVNRIKDYDKEHKEGK